MHRYETLGASYFIVDEVFFEWKPSERFAFYMHEGTNSRVEAYGELWSLADLGHNRTELRCRTALALKGRYTNSIAWFLSPVLGLGFQSVLKSVRRHLA